MAQHYYERAMKEDSHALAPVYMLSLYGKWQKLNIIDTMKRFVTDGLTYPRARISVFATFGTYILAVVSMVKFLRRDYRTNH